MLPAYSRRTHRVHVRGCRCAGAAAAASVLPENGRRDGLERKGTRAARKLQPGVRPFLLRVTAREHPWWLSDLNDPDLHVRAPAMLYHYTDAAGLTGFVKAGCQLLAAHHEYVNDSDEIRFGHKIAVEVLEGLDIDHHVKAMAIAKTSELLEGPSFIACLSTNPHVLPQWRLYANETAGYCLGFKDPESIGYAAGDDAAISYTLRECIYGADQLRARLEERFRRKIDRLAEVVDDEKSEVLAQNLAQVAWRYSQHAKHEHFKFESEWRFVVWESHPDTEYRLTRRGLTPFLFSDRLNLAEVWVGPGVGPTREKARDDVTAFLAQHRLHAKVLSWETSYRR